MPGRQPLPNGTVLAGDIRIVGLIDDGALGYLYNVEKGPRQERFQLIEFCPRTIAVRAPDGAVFAATPDAAELIKVCLTRFVRDVETLRSVPHPNLQPVLDLFTANGTAYALQPAEQNRSLAAVANSLQRLPTQDEVDKIVRPLVPALAGLHARKLFHANISPETILVGSGIEPLLVRFGGTQAFVAARTRTVHAAVTPGYSAPELYLFDESGHGPACDVFSLAATLYRVVTGRTPADVIQRSLGEAVAPASRTQGSYRPRFLQAIDAGMALDPKQRPQTIEAFGALLLGSESATSATVPTQAKAAGPKPASGQAASVSPPAVAARPASEPVAKTPASTEQPTSAATPKRSEGEAKPHLTVVPKTDGASNNAPGLPPGTKQPPAVPPPMPLDLGALLPGSYRLVGLGLALAGLLGGGMWLLERQLRSTPGRDAGPPAQVAQKAPPTVATAPPAVSPAEPPPQKTANLERKATEDRIAAERRAAEERAAAERKAAEEHKAAEEREAAEKQKAAEIERQQERQRADEAARAAEAARQQRARLAAIAAAMDRESLVALQSDDATLNVPIEQRLAQLGYLRVVTSTGYKWLKPGDGEPFRDCDSCPEMVLVPAPVRVSTAAAAAKPASGPDGSTSAPSIASAALAVGRFEITRDEFATFIADTGYDTSGGCHARIPDWKLDPQLSWKSPGFAQGGRHPVVCVSFDDARAYAAWLSQQARQPYRLPTEAEWEHAARSNTATVLRFPFGNDEREICKFANGADESAKQAYPGWQVSACSDGFTHTSPAGTFKPNHFGLYDTMGNAWEWVDECAPPRGPDGVVRQADCTAASPRILKGGSYSDRPELLEPQSRSGAEPHVRDEIAGFRIVRSVEVRPVATSAQK